MIAGCQRSVKQFRADPQEHPRMVGTNLLCQCSCISRLVYETSAERIERALRYGLELSPDAFNAFLKSNAPSCRGTRAADVAGAAFVSNRRNLKAVVARRRAGHSAFDRGERVIVAFKGTSTVMDLIQDARAGAASIDERLPRAHSGFVSMLRGSVADLVREVEGLRTPESSLLVTGHSMGGALADIFSRIIAMDVPDLDVTCVTFGQPKIWAGPVEGRHKNHRYFRIQNSSDCVCSVPMWLQHQRAVKLHPVPNVRSRWVLGRFENKPKLDAYVRNVSRLNATSPEACEPDPDPDPEPGPQKKGGKRITHRSSVTLRCNARASAGLCHGVYMDVGYLDALSLHRFRNRTGP